MYWATGRVPNHAPADLLDAIEMVRLDVQLGWRDMQDCPQATLDYLPMVHNTLAAHREREAGRG